MRASGTDAASGTEVKPRARTTIRLAEGAEAASLLAAEGSVWVAAYEEGGGKLFRIDPTTSEVVATIALEAVPAWEVGGRGMAAGAGAVWVTGGAEEAILQRIDPASNKVVAAIPLGGRWGADVAVDDKGVWVSIFGLGGRVSVVRVDPVTKRVVVTIPVEGDWLREIFTLDGTVLVRSLVGKRGTLTEAVLTVIDPTGNRVVASRRMDEALGPLAAWDGFVLAGSGRKLVRIDPRTGRPLGEPLPVRKGVSSTSLVPDEGGIWFLGYDPDDERVPATVDRLDAEAGKIDVSVDPPESPIAMAIAYRSIWLLNYEGSLTRIELR